MFTWFLLFGLSRDNIRRLEAILRTLHELSFFLLSCATSLDFVLRLMLLTYANLGRVPKDRSATESIITTPDFRYSETGRLVPE